MNTKNLLLELIYQAIALSEECLHPLFQMMLSSIENHEHKDLDWHAVNTCCLDDVLLIAVLNDVDLAVEFNEKILREAVRFVMSFQCLCRH